MCEGIHEIHHDCACNKLCGILRLIVAGAIIGSAAGMVLMYFYDHDKWLQCKTRKIMKDAQGTAQNIMSKMGMGGTDNTSSN